jgi:hypothetical protein
MKRRTILTRATAFAANGTRMGEAPALTCASIVIAGAGAAEFVRAARQ